MKKLKSVIQYECATSFKYIWLFYGIQYAFVTLITLILAISAGTFEDIGTNTLEINTLVYVGVLGVLGYNQDFKMLLQNGFTRSDIWCNILYVLFYFRNNGIYRYYSRQSSSLF